MAFTITQIKTVARQSTAIRRILYSVFYYSIAAILLFSGVSKIIDPLPTIETIKAAFKFSDEINLIVAAILPVTEVTLALMMLFRYKQRMTLITINVLFFFFFLFAVYGTVIGLNIDCGCFSNVVSSKFDITMILRNIILTTIVLWLVFVNKRFASAGRKHKINQLIKME
ncbi:MAG: MauE/DoxX family redox-associated membrane protein [Bacteroidota bacterium]